MADITRYRPDDRRAVDALYRRVFGNDAAEASRLRWDWQYRRNPNNPGAGARDLDRPRRHGHRRAVRDDAGAAVGAAARRCAGSWGMDVMVAPERQRQGLGEVLFRTWDRNVGASLGLGLSESSYRLFQKLRWPDVGPLPCLVKPLTRRALRRPNWPQPLNRLVSALTLPIVKIVSRTRPLSAEVRLIQRFDDSFTALWDELAPKFDLAVRRDAAYLNWKYVGAPHVRYCIAALRRDDRNVGYAVYRHLHEPRGRVTLLVDFLADPDDEAGLQHAARLGRPRGAAGRLRQDPHVRDARRLPPRAAARRLLPGEVDGGVRRQGERRRRAADVLREHRPLARHHRRFRSGSVIRPRPCTSSSASTPKATTSGTPRRARNQTFENIYALPRLHALFARHGVRPTYVITHPVATRPAVGGGAARAARRRRLRDRRASSRLGNAAVHAPRTSRGMPTRRRCRASSSSAQLASADRRDRRGRRRRGRCRIDRDGSGSPPTTSPALERHGYLVESSVAPLFYETHKGGPEFVEAPLRPYFLAYDSADRAGHEQPARGAGVRRR